MEIMPLSKSLCIHDFFFFSFCAARADIAEFVEYDLDNEDEDWLERFNNEKQILTPDK